MSIQDAFELIEIAIEEQDNNSMEEILIDVENNESALHQLEFRRMFSNNMDPNNAYLESNLDQVEQKHKIGLKC